MRTLLINLSPKRKNSTSGYLLQVMRHFSSCENEIIHYRGGADDVKIHEKLKICDRLVFITPLYVDGLPSHVLEFLNRLEPYMKQNHHKFPVYTVVNCGFYEGQQCEIALDMVKCWCTHSGTEFCGGIGVGAGEMFRVLRYNILFAGIFALVGLVCAIFHLHSITHTMFWNVIGFLFFFILFSFRIFNDMAKFTRSVSSGEHIDVRYTTISFCPSWLFVIFASIYWVLRALFCNGVPIWKLFKRFKQQ